MGDVVEVSHVAEDGVEAWGLGVDVVGGCRYIALLRQMFINHFFSLAPKLEVGPHGRCCKLCSWSFGRS